MPVYTNIFCMFSFGRFPDVKIYLYYVLYILPINIFKIVTIFVRLSSLKFLKKFE